MPRKPLLDPARAARTAPVRSAKVPARSANIEAAPAKPSTLKAAVDRFEGHPVAEKPLPALTAGDRGLLEELYFKRQLDPGSGVDQRSAQVLYDFGVPGGALTPSPYLEVSRQAGQATTLRLTPEGVEAARQLVALKPLRAIAKGELALLRSLAESSQMALTRAAFAHGAGGPKTPPARLGYIEYVPSDEPNNPFVRITQSGRDYLHSLDLAPAGVSE